MQEETVTSEQEQPQEAVTQQDEVQESPVEQTEQQTEQTVPLSALQKERKKRQEAEERARLYEEQQASAQRQQAEEDDYDPVTKGQLGQTTAQLKQEIREEDWIRNNPEKAQEVDENLKEFLKTRPHLSLAIKASPNRYSEAWNLMNALTPKQKVALKSPSPAKEAPGSPTAVPKAAGMNESVDVMQMTDAEFRAWRASKRKAR